MALNDDSVPTGKIPLQLEQSAESKVCKESIMIGLGAQTSSDSIDVKEDSLEPAQAESTEDVEGSVEPRTPASTEIMMDSPQDTGVGDRIEDPTRTDPVQVEHMEDSTDILKASILEHISKNTEAYFKSQQKDEPDLTVADKWKIAETLLNKSVPTFLSRYAKYLLAEHLDYFADNDDSLVQYYVEQRQNELKKSSSYSKVKP